MSLLSVGRKKEGEKRGTLGRILFLSRFGTKREKKKRREVSREEKKKEKKKSTAHLAGKFLQEILGCAPALGGSFIHAISFQGRRPTSLSSQLTPRCIFHACI